MKVYTMGDYMVIDSTAPCWGRWLERPKGCTCGLCLNDNHRAACKVLREKYLSKFTRFKYWALKKRYI